MPASLLIDKLLHHVHLDLLDLEQLLPLVREEPVEFPVQLTDFQLLVTYSKILAEPKEA